MIDIRDRCPNQEARSNRPPKANQTHDDPQCCDYEHELTNTLQCITVEAIGWGGWWGRGRHNYDQIYRNRRNRTSRNPGYSIGFSFAELKGFNLRGGSHLFPEFVALVFGLVTYTAGFIAEIVRAGVMAVSHGQTEAAAALGLPRGKSLRLVVVPQALRLITPPLTSQWLNIVKNSSLAVFIGYPDLVLVFAAPLLAAAAELPVRIQQTWPKALLLGCTGGGGIPSAKTLHHASVGSSSPDSVRKTGAASAVRSQRPRSSHCRELSTCSRRISNKNEKTTKGELPCK